jgi:epoxyqueuosine reductase QueG
MKPAHSYGDAEMTELKSKVIAWCGELGFQHTGITDIELSQAESRLADWLRGKFHGSMDYMERHGTKRSRPDELVPGTLRVISVRMDYFPESQDAAKQRLDDGHSAYITRSVVTITKHSGVDYVRSRVASKKTSASLVTAYLSTAHLYSKKHLRKKPALAGLENIPT